MSFAQWSQNQAPPPAPMPPPPTRLPWYRRTGWIVATLILLPPLGWLLAGLKREWSVGHRLVAIVVSVVWFVIILATGGDSGKSDEGDGGAPAHTDVKSVSAKKVPDLVGEVLTDAKAAAADAGFTGVTSHDASDGDSGQWSDGNWTVCFQTPKAGKRVAHPAGVEIAVGVVREGAPCPHADGEPIPYPRTPDVIGKTYREASAALKKQGITEVDAASAYTDVHVSSDPAGWTVCFQTPKAGTEITDTDTASVELFLARPGDKCPAEKGTRRNPAPAPTRTHSSGSGSGSGSDSGGSGGGSSGLQTVRGGEFCSPAGAKGITSAGTILTCQTASDGRLRFKR